MSTTERFEELLKKRKQEKSSESIKEDIKSVTVIEKKNNIIPVENFKTTFFIDNKVFEEFTTDESLVGFLKEKTWELIGIEGSNTISKGKNLCEVANELAKQGSPEGLYLKYLEFSGYKKDTALRLRKRYELFEKAQQVNTKQIISMLPVKAIELLYKSEDLLNEIESDPTVTYQIAASIILDENKPLGLPENKEENTPIFNIEDLGKLENTIKSKYDELEEKKKNKLNKLLIEIEKILN